MLGGMSPKLKPLLLPQLVEERRKYDSQQFSSPDGAFWPYALTTTNSSSSDITSPVTPTFSPRGHVRYSSSSSSLDLPPLQHDSPISPSQPSSTKSAVRHLPDVEEEPTEPAEEDFDDAASEQFGLYSCLSHVGDQQYDHRNSSDELFTNGIVSDFEIDYDIGFLSDSDCTANPSYLKKKQTGTASPLSDLTERLSSRFPTLSRWKSGKRSRMNSLVTKETSLENVLSCAPSSRSSSISAVYRHSDRHAPSLPQPGSAEDVREHTSLELTGEERSSIERDRAMATTPLLPPLLTGPFGPPVQESPLQSPTIDATPQFAETAQSPLLPATTYRPSLSTRPSTTSLRQASNSMDMPISLPPIVQEHDEWSDRLGHANFTITPQPYELSDLNTETVTKFRDDWDAARVNYTKHLVRTGENYGQTSNIYALTEAKWAETERRWRATFDDIMRQTQHSAPGSKSTSRSRSRGRGRGTSVSVAAANKTHGSESDIFAGLEWRRLEDCLPSAVPQMLEALDAHGKFPGRGDEDIVGPMQRDAVMAGAHVEDARAQRFWRNLVGKVGIGR